MSLIKQLWIAVIVLITVVFISSFAISSYSARHYFSEQLHLKNIDNANVLALSMSQMEKDPILLELMIAAQFDSGHYQQIKLVQPDGTVLQQRSYDADSGNSVPQWFVRMMPLSVEPGVAQVQDNWRQFGTLYVESHSRFVYQALWDSSRKLFFWCLLVAFLACLLGSVLLKVILLPLKQVVSQAEAIGSRRFITSTEPFTREFRKVVRAMNTLSGRVGHMMEAEGQRLDEIRHQYQHDKVTGLVSREFFLNQLEAVLATEDQAARHALLLVRITDLKHINQQLGHRRTDELLHALADVIRNITGNQNEHFSQAGSGRLRATDFALLLTDCNSLWQLSNALEQQLKKLSERYKEISGLQLSIAGSYFHSGEPLSQLLLRVDGLLAVAEHQQHGNTELCLEPELAPAAVFTSAEQWRQALTEALQQPALQLQYYPVVSLDGTLLHQEAMVRLTLGGEVRTAGFFIAWARRLGLLPQLDLAVMKLVLQELQRTGSASAVAVNLSAEILRDGESRQQLKALLQDYPAEAAHLWLEFNEQTVISELPLLAGFGQTVRAAGCKLGLQAAGHHMDHFPELQAAGLDYLKLDSALLRPSAEGNVFIQGLCTLGHSVGLVIIADGLNGEPDLAQLQLQGIDAVSGPAIRYPLA